MRYFSILISLLVALLWAASNANAQLAVQMLSSDDHISLSDSFLIYEEQHDELTLSDILQNKSRFRWAGKNNPNYGFSERGVWLHTRFAHFTETNDWVIDLNFSQLDKVDFYVMSEGEVIAQSQQGKLRVFQPFRIPSLNVSIQPGQTAELFIRIQSKNSSLIAPVNIRSEASHTRAMLIDSVAWGLFYGGLIILAIYNLVLFFSVREPSLLAYVGYIITVLIWQFVWGGHVHLVAAEGLSPWLIDHTGLIFVFIGVSSGIFSVTFLNTKQNAPRSHTVVVALIYLQAGLGVVALLPVLPPMVLNGIIYGAAILAIGSYIVAGIESYTNQFLPARYFIFAWGLLSAGAIVGLLSLVGVLPANRFTAYCFQVGVFLEAGLFSLALMDKSRNQLEREVEQATTDLRNNMELIEEQNARLDIARKDAIKASNIKSQFLANMSHEIRTPLNAILGFSRELSHAQLAPEKQEQVRIINSAADNLLTIVNDVLDFSKIEAGKLQVHRQPFSLNQLLEDMVSMMAKSAHQKQLEFIFELSPLPNKLIGDGFRLKQILNNLLGNAIKFTAQGFVAFTASGRSLDHGLYELTLKIEDTGIGISRHDKKKLFNAFSQVDDSLNRNYQGTGLGLVISQELVKLMRGQLTLTSTPGQGSCFVITLQLNQLSAQYCLSEQNEWRDKHVVVFDPLPVSRHASASLMRHLGATVTSIESIEYLNQFNKTSATVDYLFASLPLAKREQRNDVLSYLLDFKASKRVLLYSGADPFNHYPSLSQHFNTQMRLPLSPQKIDSLLHSPSQSSQNPLYAKLASLPRIHVLAVDDMEMNLKLINTWLQNTPVNLTVAISGAEAVALCQSTAFDIILMDVQMPNMDGLQATKMIRKTEHNIGTPIIAVTAHAFKEEQERLMASGMDDYLPKPIEIGQLVDLINRWCENVEPTPEQIPSFDWELALRRANGSDDAAFELLEAFIQQLPDCIDMIKTAARSKDFETLLQHIHRIHGACCYTGVSRFQALCHDIESDLKQKNMECVLTKIPALLKESEVVLSAARAHLDSR
ncbi:response regulator [Alteromonas sp. SM 2104]|nr:response regulator [Alteromonas oceanisediminis]